MARFSTTPRADPPPANRPRLTRPVHRDLAHLLADGPHYVRRLGSEAFACLIVLQSVRIHGPKPHRIHFQAFARQLAVSPTTVRRWLRTLKRAGLVSSRFVPGTHNAEAYIEVRIAPDRRHR